MTNPVRGEADLKLKDGRTLTLVLDFEAYVAAEAAYGKPLAALTIDAATGFVGAMRAMFFGALRSNHLDIDVLEAGRIMSTDAVAVEAAMELAAKRAYPEEDKEPGKAESPRHGKASGASGAKSASTRKPSGGKRRAPSR